MKPKAVALTAMLLTVACVALVISVSRAQTIYTRGQLSPADEERRGTIAWHVKRAKLRGVDKVRLLPVIDTPAAAGSLDEVLPRYTVVVAQLVKKKSYIATEDSLTTWNKFKVSEVLSAPPGPLCSGCARSLPGPPDMLPLAAGEILLATNGGSVVVDGVEVEIKDRDLGQHFSESKKYLLFLSLDGTSGLGRLQLGQRGVFVVNAENQISPIDPENSPLSRDLRTRFNNSLTLLREGLRKL